MNRFFKDIRTIERMKDGPLGRYITAYAQKLHTQGFSWQSGRRKLQLAADFCRWLKRHGVGASQGRANTSANICSSAEDLVLAFSSVTLRQ